MLSTLAPSCLESLRRLAHFGVDVLLAVGVPETFVDHADLQALRAPLERAGVIADLGSILPRVETVRPGEHLQHQRVVGHLGRHRAGVVDAWISIGITPV